jgi:hypothetical protein
MTRPNNRKRRPLKPTEDKRANRAVPLLRVKKGASLKAIYAAARRAFTAADLQKYTEFEGGIPAEQVLAELEATDREQTKRRKSKRGYSA